MRPYILKENNWKTVKETSYDLVILPWAACEAHNFHLPYGTDIYEADDIAGEAARKAWNKGAKITVLPTIPFGVNTGQTDIKLDINMYPSTQFAILNDIIEMLQRQGMYKLLVFNSHGGNDFKTMLRELGVKYPKMFLSTCHWFKSLDKSVYFEESGDHADEMETSLIMHLHPHLVATLEQASDEQAKSWKVQGLREDWAWAERQWSQVTADTGVGNPKKSSVDKGKRYFDDVTDKIAELFIDLARVDIDDLYE